MWLENVSECGQDGRRCPTCGGPVKRRQYGEMYAGAFVADGERVEIRRVPDPSYSDPVVLDPLTQYFDGRLYRFRLTDKYFSGTGGLLHRMVWKSAFGPIPKGCHIHHKDGSPTNNLLSNLECLPASEHLSHASRKHNDAVSASGGEHFTDLARKKAAEWHCSEAGRLWHKRHAQRAKAWLKWKRESRECEYCGKEYLALVRKSGHSQKYCTLACKAAAYRLRQEAENQGRCVLSHG